MGVAVQSKTSEGLKVKIVVIGAAAVMYLNWFDQHGQHFLGIIPVSRT